MLSVLDHKKKDTLLMDLWTKDMPVDEMKQFFHQTLVSMAGSFERATDDQKMTATMNEEQIWRYFIENDLLYSTDTQLNKRFIENAPF